MTLINDFMSLIYPRRCEACSNMLFQHEVFICNFCALNLPKSDYHKKPENELQQVFAGRIPFTEVMSFYVFEKSGKVQKLLHNIKYQNQKELACYLGEQYAKELLKDGFNFGVDIIIPIPLHPKKLKQRGYNQSEWFAKGIAEATGALLDITSLTRVSETQTQTRKKKYERWENVDGIFALNLVEKLKGKHILLVDDVITTGATIEAAWQVFKKVEDIKISVAAIAFAARRF
ncbi:MAG: putative amidophosphoribosyltransferase [Bacteroidetes bacterium]|nr:putative amidophosphoribosyltransferase [Bacteroidota bacterium]